MKETTMSFIIVCLHSNFLVTRIFHKYSMVVLRRYLSFKMIVEIPPRKVAVSESGSPPTATIYSKAGVIHLHGTLYGKVLIDESKLTFNLE